MSKRIYDVVHGNGTYKGQDGQEKTRWQNVGVIIESDKGNLSMKLDAIPTLRNEKGELWLNLFVPQDREQVQKPSAPQQGGFRRESAPQQNSDDSDVPW